MSFVHRSSVTAFPRMKALLMRKTSAPSWGEAFLSRAQLGLTERERIARGCQVRSGNVGIGPAVGRPDKRGGETRQATRWISRQFLAKHPPSAMEAVPCSA